MYVQLTTYYLLLLTVHIAILLQKLLFLHASECHGFSLTYQHLTKDHPFLLRPLSIQNARSTICKAHTSTQSLLISTPTHLYTTHPLKTYHIHVYPSTCEIRMGFQKNNSTQTQINLSMDRIKTIGLLPRPKLYLHTWTGPNSVSPCSLPSNYIKHPRNAFKRRDFPSKKRL